jgi:hypothetical protein
MSWCCKLIIRYKHSSLLSRSVGDGEEKRFFRHFIKIVSALTATVTEVVSNTATANIVLPILKEMSLTLCYNPVYMGKSGAEWAGWAGWGCWVEFNSAKSIDKFVKKRRILFKFHLHVRFQRPKSHSAGALFRIEIV